MKNFTQAEFRKLAKVRLPSRGGWIASRAAHYRAEGKRPLEAMTEAAKDWDDGRKIARWDYAGFA